MNNLDIISMLRKVINEETKFQRLFTGKVLSNIDDLKKGRVLCSVYELGWDTQDRGVWCYPVSNDEIKTPNVNDYVMVGFVNSNPSLPFYFGKMNNLVNMLPSKFDGNYNTEIVYQSKNLNGLSISYDNQAQKFTIADSTNTLTIDSTGFVFQGGSQPFVLGTALDTWITGTLLTIFNAHVHTSASAGSPTSTPTSTLTAPNNYLSQTIKGK